MGKSKRKNKVEPVAENMTDSSPPLMRRSPRSSRRNQPSEHRVDQAPTTEQTDSLLPGMIDDNERSTAQNKTSENADKSPDKTGQKKETQQETSTHEQEIVSTETWSVPSGGKKRKLTETETKSYSHGPCQIILECEKCNTKDEEIARMTAELESLRSQMEKMQIEHKQVLKPKDEHIIRLKSENEQLAMVYEEEKRAKNNVLLRLSEIASNKLRDNNPNIADLSDENRPTKIAEKLSELYDNEWTDAFDSLQNDLDETKTIEFLRELLMSCYQHCSNLASDSYFKKVQSCIELPIQERRSSTTELELPDQLKHQIKEFRKFSAKHVITDVQNVIKDTLKIPYDHLTEVQKYLSSCVEICWFMVVQDPPLVLTIETSTKFDTNMYKEYTQRGPAVEYVVWPALLLHHEGPLLSKGVAQGRHV